MKLILKEDPKEWRKTALLVAGAVAAVSSLLRCRGKIHNGPWAAALIAMTLVAALAFAVPRLFRGFYRLSQRLGYISARAGGCVLLAIVFVVIFAPMGLVMRALGQDPLRLKRPARDASCWVPAKETSPLDRLF